MIPIRNKETKHANTLPKICEKIVNPKLGLGLSYCQRDTITHNQANKLGLPGYQDMEAFSAKIVGSLKS